MRGQAGGKGCSCVQHRYCYFWFVSAATFRWLLEVRGNACVAHAACGPALCSVTTCIAHIHVTLALCVNPFWGPCICFQNKLL